MNELRSILKRWNQLEARSEAAALATVVSVKGSAFRRPGARMLIAANGEVVGGVSGGCLENDVIERAQRVIADGLPVVAVYDTRKDDALLGIGAGCHGIIHVQITPLGNSAATNDAAHLHWLAQAAHQRQAAVLVSLVGPVGGLDHRIERALWAGDGAAAGGFTDTKITDLALVEARHALASGQSSSRTLRPADRGTATDAALLVEYVAPPIALLIFGAGHDAIPLVHFAGGLGWEISVIDKRPAWASAERFPLADHILIAAPTQMDGQMRIDHRTAAVVMTHQYEHDLELLKRLLPSPAAYIGILGSRDRTRRLWKDLRMRMDVPESRIAGRVFAPVGLDLGAQSPDEIALAIVAEIHAVFGGRAGAIYSLSAPQRQPSD